MGETEYTIFLSVSFIVAIITFVMGIVSFGVKARSSTLFGLLMVSIAVWCLGVAGQMMSTTELMSLRWIYGQMLGVVLVPPFWLLFTLHYSNRQSNLRWWMYPLLFLNSAIVMILLIVPLLRHHLVIELVYERVLGYLVNTEWKIGPYFWVHLTITFIFVLLGDFFILRHTLQWSKSDRKKLIAVIIATFFPLFTNLSLVLNLFPAIHGNVDVFGFAGTGIVLGWVLFKDKLLELQPIAARHLMEELPDPLLVFNDKLELVECNPSAKELMGNPPDDGIMKKLDGIIAEFSLNEESLAQKRIVLPWEKTKQHFDIQLSRLRIGNRIVGYQLLMRDVTELIHSMEKLEQLATTDSLTGLQNRRYFQLEGERIFDRAVRYQHPICVMTFDIDHFKQVNDQYGHHVGDEVLKKVAELIRKTTRKVDIVARFGGDEFFILLPESTTEYAVALAERLQDTFKNQPILVDDYVINISASFGIAGWLPNNEKDATTLDELMRYSDQKLYDAKDAGRNKVSF